MRIEKAVLSRSSAHWGRAIAEEVLKEFPDLQVYTVSAGISPSGAIHYGNLRDVVTAYAVKMALEEMGKKVRFVFIFDNYDRFRKVPEGLNESYEQYIGMPLSSVPDPDGEFDSWAQRHEVEFMASIEKMNLDLEFVDATKEYTTGVFDDAIIRALQNREKIAEILLRNMSDKSKITNNINEDEYKEKYYPISVYSSFTGKDNTEILNYDGDKTITYRCRETGNEETIDFTKDHRIKLAWKTDWGMRWEHYNVHFEPAGKGHGSPNGSYDVSSEICTEIYGGKPPMFYMYEFIGIRGLGAKMSGSKGNSVTPSSLMELYEIPLLLWLYYRKLPNQRFDLAFDSEVIRQYSELDRALEQMRSGNASEDAVGALIASGADKMPELPIPFRHAIALGQIVQWDIDKVMHMLDGLGMEYSRTSVESRLPKAKVYLEKYNRDEMVSLLDEKNIDYMNDMDDMRKLHVAKLREVLESGLEDIPELEKLMYDIPKNDAMDEDARKKAQRSFFKDVYRLLIGKDTGPRLSTFLWAIDRKKAIHLLTS